MDTTLLGLAAGAAGWKAGHTTISAHGPLLRPTHPAVPDLVTDPEVELCQRAAAHARRYMRKTLAAQPDLTPAMGVRVFVTYMYAFMRGVYDEATHRAIPGEEQW